ncbi:hypothetical protein [Streptomyces graminilatus]|uniref:hypothetical protein n=1 Tax=Streptomyces graminilatus TaxID=1464070 RepID=UPI000AEFD56D|nr:hypothetical protein [Streptomyces graminilatus]
MSTSLRSVVALAAVLAATSCTSHTTPTATAKSTPTSPAAGDRPVAKKLTCREGQVHWGSVLKRQTLVAVSDAQRFDVPAGKSIQVTFEAVPVRSLKATISSALSRESLDPRAAVASLEEETGIQLEEVGTSFSLSAGDKILKTRFGKFSGTLLNAVGVNTVEASFAYGCGTSGQKSMRGTLQTWAPVTYSSLLKCGINEKLSKVELEAQALMCDGQAKNPDSALQ